MSELAKLEAKVKLAKYAETLGFYLYADHGNWVAIMTPSDKLVHVDEETAKKRITATIKDASKRKGNHARLQSK